jgi:5-methylcytosine-specific restriction endonuclease McrA
MSEAKQKSCAYCHATDDLTDDHIPPQNLFPKPRPSNLNLITVPACRKCNGSASKDDEYFRYCLCMCEKVGRDEQAAK